MVSGTTFEHVILRMAVPTTYPSHIMAQAYVGLDYYLSNTVLDLTVGPRRPLFSNVGIPVAGTLSISPFDDIYIPPMYNSPGSPRCTSSAHTIQL